MSVRLSGADPVFGSAPAGLRPIKSDSARCVQCLWTRRVELIRPLLKEPEMKPACLLVPFVLSMVGVNDAQSNEPLGRTEYETHCVACHGADGRGDGPASRELKLPIPDLGTLAQRHGGSLPAERIRRMIDGRENIKGHAGRQMPLWGARYAREATGSDPESVVQQRIEALTNHLRTLQR